MITERLNAKKLLYIYGNSFQIDTIFIYIYHNSIQGRTSVLLQGVPKFGFGVNAGI